MDNLFSGTLDPTYAYLLETAKSQEATVLVDNTALVTLGDRMSAYAESFDGFEVKNYNVCLASTYLRRFLKETAYFQ